LSGRFIDMGLEPEWFSLRRPIDWGGVSTLRKIMRRRGVEVFHAHDFTGAVYGAAACRLDRLPYVITLHGGAYYAGRAQRRVAFRWAVKGARATVGVSNATSAEAVDLLGLSAESVRVIPNGIGFEPGDPGAVRHELALPPGAPLILAVGNLYPVKGHAVLVAALQALRARQPELEWRAVIAGRGGEEESLRAAIQSGGLDDRLTLLGFRSDVPDLLSAADVYVMPSLSEGLPLALVEAMFSATAVVASDVGGVPEVVEHQRSALLAPPSDAAALSEALEAVLTDPGLRQRLADQALAVAGARFSLEGMVRAYRRAYSGLPPEINPGQL